MANPAAERAQYDTDTDKELTLLRFQRASDLKNIGVLTVSPKSSTGPDETNQAVPNGLARRFL